VKLLPENVILTIVGDGPDIPALRASIRKEGLDERVELMGSVSRSRVLELYEEYDVFFFPSMHDSGGFVVLEAMSEGLPVICLDRGGPALAVEEDCGIVVPAGNKSDTVSRLVSAVHRYMADPDLLEKHGKNAISRIHTDYSWSAQTRRMQKIYSDLSILKQQTVTDDA
jgi:glycosyltransferase involved in cell wall biosynthesis